MGRLGGTTVKLFPGAEIVSTGVVAVNWFRTLDIWTSVSELPKGQESVRVFPLPPGVTEQEHGAIAVDVGH